MIETLFKLYVIIGVYIIMLGMTSYPGSLKDKMDDIFTVDGELLSNKWQIPIKIVGITLGVLIWPWGVIRRAIYGKKL